MSDQDNPNQFPGGSWQHGDSGDDGHGQGWGNGQDHDHDHGHPPGNPSEILYAYNIDPLGGKPGDCDYVLTSPFPIRPQTVESFNSSPVLSGGEHFKIVGQNDVQTYIGTATDDATGTVVGFIFEDSTTGKYFLFSKNPYLWSGTKLDLNASTGPNDQNDANWNLNTGSAVCYCFLAGTAVATPDGEVAVETLKTGDMVVLSDGRIAPVSWLGVQTVSTRFADPLRVLPVRIQAGALADGLPKRDLLMSPDHAVMLHGLLVQAGAMVNNISITREPAMPELFRYYHVEVADHSFILAEGVPAETFIDNVSRMAFDNWEERDAVSAIEEMSLPRVKSARQLPSAVREQLKMRAAQFQQPGLAA
ncbi:MAG: Hint domain-containing protein [Rhodospirillales bacterium]|nr:Hint domain-containing protein [Rhodospirillales bacterium]MDE2319945.1 Hint domain-containing protein [Rhodospirillales bacterium]